MNSDVPLHPFPFHGGGVTAVVTTRHGGVSTGPHDSLNLGGHVGDDPKAVAENRHRLAAAVGAARVTFADQKHTDRIAIVGEPPAGRGHDGPADGAAGGAADEPADGAAEGPADVTAVFPATDAMITNLPGVALAILVADCAPVVLYDPARRVIGVAHSGRVGTIKGIVPKTIAAMTRTFGSAPDDLLIGIGPTIGAVSYEIGAAEAAEVAAAFGPDGKQLLAENRPGHALFDLPGAIRQQLHLAGIPSANVHDMAIDTRQSTDTFFSDRAVRPCGRFAAVARLNATVGRPRSRWPPR